MGSVCSHLPCGKSVCRGGAHRSAREAHAGACTRGAHAEVQVEASARGSRTQSEARQAAIIRLPPGREGSFSGQLSLLAENPRRELSWDCAVCLGVSSRGGIRTHGFRPLAKCVSGRSHECQAHVCHGPGSQLRGRLCALPAPLCPHTGRDAGLLWPGARATKPDLRTRSRLFTSF